MASRQGFSLGSAIGGALALALVMLVVGAIIVFGGLYPVGASTPHTAGVYWLISEARDHSVERSASGLTPPQLTPADIRMGGEHFKGMCAECHGGPGAKPEEFAAGMNPTPPNLVEATDDLSVSQVFWIAKNGLKMTGMPAFGKNGDDAELWRVAAFVKQMSKMTPADYAALRNAHEEGSEKTGDKHAENH